MKVRLIGPVTDHSTEKSESNLEPIVRVGLPNYDNALPPEYEIGKTRCALNKWRLFSPRGSTLTNACAAVFPLRAHATQKTNLQVGLDPNHRRCANVGPD